MNTDEALFKNKKMGNAYQYREPNVEVNPLIGSSVHILIFFLFSPSFSLSLKKIRQSSSTFLFFSVNVYVHFTI